MMAAIRAWTAVVFEFNGCRVWLDPVPAPHLQWLREFLTPAFTLHEDMVGDSGHRVTLRIEPDRYRRLREAGPDGHEVDAFVLDSGIVRLPSWHHDGDGLAVFDESTQVFYRVDGYHTTVLSEVDRPAVRIALMRVIRELASSHAIRSGALLLHAAAFVIDGRAVIVAGPKRAGKTTLLMQALDSGRAGYLSNDRVVVSNTENGLLTHGMPTIVSIRATTLPLLPDLAERLDGYPYHFRSTLAEVRRSPPAPPNTKPRRTLSPTQLCALTNTSAVAVAPPALILFPELDGARATPQLTALGPDEAIERLNASRLGAPQPGRQSELFRAPPAPTETTATAAHDDHPLATVPAYRYHPATANPDAASALAAIVECLR